MDLRLSEDADGTSTRATRAALAEAGVEPSPGCGRAPSAWWRAGVEEARERAPVAARYEAAPPRSTRGATRA